MKNALKMFQTLVLKLWRVLDRAVIKRLQQGQGEVVKFQGYIGVPFQLSLNSDTDSFFDRRPAKLQLLDFSELRGNVILIKHWAAANMTAWSTQYIGCIVKYVTML